MTNWLVVANAARARILEETGHAKSYVERADLVHPASRNKGTDLGADRAGHAIGSGSAGTAYTSRTSPRERERDRFAREVAEMLNQAIASGDCAGWVLAASNPFLGHVKSHLTPNARKALLATLPDDLTGLSNAQIADRIGALGAA